MYEFNRSIDLDYLYCCSLYACQIVCYKTSTSVAFCFVFFLKGNVVEYANEEIDHIQNEMEDERTVL